jgi:hypothetical protein
MSAFTVRGLGDDSSDLMIAPPPITTSVAGGYPSSDLTSVLFGSAGVLGTELQQAQVTAANQGFFSMNSLSAWLAQNWPLVGIGVFVLFMLPQAGPARYGR